MDTFLSKIQPFSTLSERSRNEIIAASQEIRYDKGQTIFRKGQQSNAIWVVKRGRVHLMNFMNDGKVAANCVLTDGDPFCCLPALDKKDYPADAIAMEDSLIVRIPSHLFHQAMANEPSFMQDAVCYFCERLREVENKGCMIYASAEQRLAQTILTLSKKFDGTIPMTRQEISELAGLTLETTIRVLSRFTKSGLIASERGRITVLDPEGIQALSSSS